MKLIITGATGFIGRNFAEFFSTQGYDVLATGRSVEIGNEISEIGIPYRQIEITDRNQVLENFKKADCVIHCAGQAGDWGKYKEFYNVNVTGTKNVIDACIKYGIQKIIFISTPSIYYNGQNRFNVKESDPLPDRQFKYGKTKLLAEEKLLESQIRGIQSIIFRPRAVYGKYDRIIVPRILKMAEGKHLPLINNGEAKVDITYIGNLNHALHCALKSDSDAWNQVYNISNGCPISVKDWFKTLLEVFEREFNAKSVPLSKAMKSASLMQIMNVIAFGSLKPTLTKFSVGYMGSTLTMSVEKAKELLGYEPQYTNRAGFDEYKNFYKSLNN